MVPSMAHMPSPRNPGCKLNSFQPIHFQKTSQSPEPVFNQMDSFMYASRLETLLISHQHICCSLLSL